MIDDVSCNIGNLAVAASSPNRLLYVSPTLTDPLHISGTVEVDIRLASSR